MIEYAHMPTINVDCAYVLNTGTAERFATLIFRHPTDMNRRYTVAASYSRLSDPIHQRQIVRDAKKHLLASGYDV